MKKTLLITGGCGFIGSNFIRHVVNKYPNYSVINLDKLTYAGNPENLKDVKGHKNYFFIKGDICNPSKLKTILKTYKKIDCIINFAAESHVDRSISDPNVFIKNNVFGVNTLLEFAKANKIKKFLQISTDEVYGSIQSGSFTEKSPLLPNSPYSASKASADLLVRSYHKTFGLPVITTRSSNNFGSYQFPEKIIPLFITNLLQNKKIPVYGTGLNIRDWIHVKDNCKAIDLALHKGTIGEIYNIGAGHEITNLTLTKTILKLMNKNKTSIKYVKDRLGHDLRYSIDCSKIKKLGWKPNAGFNQAIQDTIEWYTTHTNWWKKLI